MAAVDGSVVHIVEASFAGVGRHVLDLARVQVERGTRVHVIYGTERESESFRREREALTDVTWHPADLSRAMAAREIVEVRRLHRLLRALEPAVVHGHSTKGGLVARLLGHRAHFVCYTPNAVYSMNPLLSPAARKIVGAIEYLLSKRTDAIIAVSPEEQVHMTSLRIPAEKIVLVPNGVDEFTQPQARLVRDELGIPPDVPVVGFVGRLDAQKAPSVFVDVCERVARTNPDVHFALVGDGPLRSEIDAQLRSADLLDGRFHVLGQRPGRWAMSAFDVFLLPSRYEGFPYVLLEAAAAGLPIVTTDRACASAIVQPGITGKIEPFEDPAALAEAVRWALLQPSSLAYEAKSAAAGFTLARMADLPYNDLLAVDPTPPPLGDVHA